MKHVTIKDVARKLNVSVSSVSRAFNDKYDIKEETKTLILKTANDMGYFPNPIAKKLSQNKTFNIGVVVPEFVNEFYSEVIIAIQEVLISNNYQVLVMQSDENPVLELKNAKTLIHNMVDGLIIAPTMESNNMDYYLNQIQLGCPIVFMSRIEKSLAAPKVVFNNQKWSFFATEHLIREGHKKIYYLSGKKSLCVSKDRIKGFTKAMNKHKVSKDNYKIIEAGIMAKEGIEIVEDLIYNHDLPDAFFCFNDLIAIGVIKSLKNNGYKIPDDVAVMGFTETQMAELITPQLSSVRQPTYDMGRETAKLLLKQINGETEIPETVVMNGELNIRKSSRKLSHSLTI